MIFQAGLYGMEMSNYQGNTWFYVILPNGTERSQYLPTEEVLELVNAFEKWLTEA
jgi:hypothetical protein